MDRTCLADTKTIRGQWWICNVSENRKFRVVEVARWSQLLELILQASW